MSTLNELLLIGRNPDGMSVFLPLYTYTNPLQYPLVNSMPWLQQLLGTTSVRLPTKPVYSFHPRKIQRLNFVPTCAMARMTQLYGPKPMQRRSVSLVVFPEKPTLRHSL